MKKLLNMILAFFVVLSALPLVNAQASELSFAEIEVEGTSVVLNDEIMSIAIVKDLTESRETSLPIRVRLTSTKEFKDLKVSAWIGGYEFGVPRATSDPFDMTTYNTQVVKSVVLNVPLPKDLESSKEYKLNVEAFNNEITIKKEIKLNIEGKRHFVDLFDVVVNPGLRVDAGTPLIIKARLENLGDRVEDNIKVTAKANLVDKEGNSFTVSDSDFIDELVPRSEERGDDESSTSTDDLLLIIPKSTKQGAYKLFVDVNFNRGTETVSAEYDLTINGKESAISDADILISSSEASKSTPKGTQVVYPVQIANLGKEARTLIFDVTGVKDWAAASVSPAALTVAPGSTSELFVTVTATEGATQGSHIFALKVLENSETVKELNLQGQVVGITQSTTSEFRKGLEMAFLVLLGLLIILGIVVAIRKATMKSETEEAKGETYY
ncbi:hypothetical protein HY500_02380 [Candidatus Woesearchaeota archaeon]|nr:hypothetical protein [Candidatus Woesearchaeota archaeon]